MFTLLYLLTYIVFKSKLALAQIILGPIRFVISYSGFSSTFSESMDVL